MKLVTSILLLASCGYGQEILLHPRKLSTTLMSTEPASYTRWVVMPVVYNIAGNSFDALSSWKQPEANKFFMQSAGPYQNKFYREAVGKKAAMVGSVAAVSLAVGYKWPRTRRILGVINGAYGVTFTGIAISNVVRNPYYR